MKAYQSASQIISRLSKKYDCNKAWLWEVLDDYFNMRKGEAALMNLGEIEAFKDIIEELIEK